MSKLGELIAAYERHGYGVRTGLNPAHFGGDRRVSYTHCYDADEDFVSSGGGLSLQESYLIESIGSCIQPKRIFGIGNAFGWSTLMLSMVFPDSDVVVVDNLSEGADARKGFDLTRAIADDLGLRVHLVEGRSPDDVAGIVESRLGGIDFALVDGLHTNEQQSADYTAIKPFLGSDSVALFHDVLDWGLLPSFEKIRLDWSGYSEILHRTPSGMGILCGSAAEQALAPVLKMFVEPRLAGFVPVTVQDSPGFSLPLRKRIKKRLKRARRGY